jgi:Ca-activated chloride channel family protein
VLLQFRAFRLGRRDLAQLGYKRSDGTVQTLYLVKTFFSALMFDLAFALVVLALADPSWGERPVEEDRENLDVVVVVDISRSMLATDTGPSRLSRGLSVVRSVSRQLPSARFAVVVFKGGATILLPLTEDLNALEAVLDGVTPNLVSSPGSDLEAGIDVALEAFPEGANAHRAVLVVSDGESLSGTPDRAARTARAQGIPVITIVTGTEEGATVPAGDGSPVLDEEGRPVVSRAQPAVLQAIAEITDSSSFRVDELNVVTLLAEELREYVSRRDAAGFRLVAVRRYPLFLAAGLVAFLMSVAVRVIRWAELF